MKEIPLTRGKVAKVDDADFEWLSRYNWHARLSDGHWYATTNIWDGKKKVKVQMHRLILGMTGPDFGDHHNRDSLDNQRHNLRPSDHFQNAWNAPGKGGTSKYKGVSWNTEKKKWRVAIMAHRKAKLIGYFDDEKEAARAYNAWAAELHGEFAWLNDVGPGEHGGPAESK